MSFFKMTCCWPRLSVWLRETQHFTKNFEQWQNTSFMVKRNVSENVRKDEEKKMESLVAVVIYIHVCVCLWVYVCICVCECMCVRVSNPSHRIEQLLQSQQFCALHVCPALPECSMLESEKLWWTVKEKARLHFLLYNNHNFKRIRYKNLKIWNEVNTDGVVCATWYTVYNRGLSTCDRGVQSWN